MNKAAPSNHRYEPDVVLPPGDTLAEVLEDVHMSQAELATRTGLSTKHINQIVNGSAPITPETALLLERATGLRARVWNNLEVAYREHISRTEEDGRLAADLDWLKELPVRELVRRGWVEDTTSDIARLRSVCRFFGVANRAAWESLWEKPTAYRKSKAFNSDSGALAAWLRIGELRAAPMPLNAFDRSSLADLLDDFRSLTRNPDPNDWWPSLESRCAAVGVAVVAEPEIKGARINGAARWLSPRNALVQLSLRHKWSDIFWFTFFHEIAHLLIHSKKDTFINDLGSHSGVEQEADAFASQVLIPRRFEADLGELRTTHDVEEFAELLDIAPGIVVGRLQHEQRWPFNRGNDLKQLFVFVD